MSVYKFCVFMVCVRILVDYISVFVIRVGWVCSVIKVMDIWYFGNCESFKMNFYKILLNYFLYRV